MNVSKGADSMNKNNLPNNLYELRRQAGLSQEEFSERLGVSRQAVSKWERGEAYPDTENLIAISEMFSVTIDELLKSDNISSDAFDKQQEESANPTDSSNDSGFHVNVGNKVKLDLNGEITVDDEDTKVKIDFDNGDITVNDEDGQVKVGLGNGGIIVNSDDGVKVKLGKHGIEIHSSDDDNDVDDDDDDDNYPKGSVASIFYAVPYPIVMVVVFLALGIFFDAWYWAWTLFLTIPIYYPLISAIHRKRFSLFPYPVFITFLFCLFGMLWGIWHPMWIMYLTVPIYYPIASAIDRKIKKS